MKQEDVDKIIRSIVDFKDFYKDLQSAKADGEVTWPERGQLALKHGFSIAQFAIAIPEIGREFVDVDSEESQEVVKKLYEVFGGNEAKMQALGKMAANLAGFKEGLVEFINAEKQE